MAEKKLSATWNYAEGWIQSQWQDFIKPAYKALEEKNYEQARLIILSICNSTVFYQEKTKIKKDIDELKPRMNNIMSLEFAKAKREKDGTHITMQQDAVQAMFDILQKINYMFANIGCFVSVYFKDPVADSTRMY